MKKISVKRLKISNHTCIFGRNAIKYNFQNKQSDKFKAKRYNKNKAGDKTED